MAVTQNLGWSQIRSSLSMPLHFNKTHLHSTIECVSPFEFEKRYYDSLILSGLGA